MIYLTVFNQYLKENRVLKVRKYEHFQQVMKAGNWCHVLHNKNKEFQRTDMLAFEFGKDKLERVKELFKDYRYLIWDDSFILLFLDKIISSKKEYVRVLTYYQWLVGLKEFRVVSWWNKTDKPVLVKTEGKLFLETEVFYPNKSDTLVLNSSSEAESIKSG